MKLLSKILKKAILLILIIGIVLVSYICFDGYKLYKSKVEKVPIEIKVENIKNDENFLEYNEIPPEFCNAILAIEDHKFFFA